jgi:zinc transport system substrate-binding protein
MLTTYRWKLLIFGVIAAATLTACGTTTDAVRDGKVHVVAAFYPLQFLAERIGGDAVSVVNLVKPGAEPHDLELTPDQVGAIEDAGLVLYLGGFQPAVDEAVLGEARNTSLDVTTVQKLNAAPKGEDGKDPHVWLDPQRLATIGDAVADRLGRADTANADRFKERAAALHKELAALDTEYANGLRHCDRHEIVTSHAAFGYVADRYGLTQLPITGINPDEEPSPQRLADVVAVAKEHHVTTVFFETLVSPKIAQTLADAVGAKAEVLDPIEGLEPGATGDYLSVMRENLTKLRTALGCA